MKTNFYLLLLSLILCSCSSKNQLIYLKDVSNESFSINKKGFNKIEVGDILKIDVQSTVPEAALPYNNISSINNPNKTLSILLLEGYLVDNNNFIDFPILGKINTENHSINELEEKIKKILLDGKHLVSPTVKVRKLNSKFTVLGEVRNPGTFNFYEDNINIFQALGYAGDLTIEGKRDNILLIRQEKGLNITYKISLNDINLLKQKQYNLKNNDVLIVQPNFSKVKSAGFIGSPASISSIASILFSATILIINLQNGT